jgi:hypothetical protein
MRGAARIVPRTSLPLGKRTCQTRRGHNGESSFSISLPDHSSRARTELRLEASIAVELKRLSIASTCIPVGRLGIP